MLERDKRSVNENTLRIWRTLPYWPLSSKQCCGIMIALLCTSPLTCRSQKIVATANLGLQNIRLQAVGYRPRYRRYPTVALHDWPNLFWLRDLEWPILNGYRTLTPTYHCLPLYIGASCNHLIYTVGTSSSVKDQYATAGTSVGFFDIPAAWKTYMYTCVWFCVSMDT